MYYVIERETIPKLKTEIGDLIKQAKDIKHKKSELYFDIVDTIKSKKQELKQLQQGKKDYLLNNSKYIFHYYEEKQKIKKWGMKFPLEKQ